MAHSIRRKAAVVLIIAILIAVSVWLYLLYSNNKVLGHIASTGIVEATEVSFGPKAAGTIEWLCCDEGDGVRTGQELIKMESAGLLARLDEAGAGALGAHESVSEAKVSLEAAVAQNSASGFELEAAVSEVERVKALADDAGRNIERTRGLFKDGYVSAKDMDSAEAGFNSISAQLDSAKARKRTSESNYRITAVGIKSAGVKVSLAKARLRQAQAQVKVLEAALSDQTVSSTIDGVVAYKAFEAGENAVPGQAVYTVYDLGNRWVRVDIDESIVARVLLGADTEVRLPADTGRVFKGRVTEIGVVGGFATQRDVTRGRADIKTFRVKAAVEDPQGALKPGMTVEVRIRSDNAKGALER
ncbi:MAG: efflux RND transporter periplasmic adaptor subunit [Deltaproteobacteria bacterium]